MLNDELPEHAKIALEGARMDFLKSLRGRSDVYDSIRMTADRFMKATGAPDSIRAALEGTLILQLNAFRVQAGVEERKAVVCARNAERSRIRHAIGPLLKED